MSVLQPEESLTSLTDNFSVDWEAFLTFPFEEWECARETSNLTLWIQKISKMNWSDDDQHFFLPQYTVPVTRLLRLVALEYCRNLELFDGKMKDIERAAADSHNAEEAIRARAELFRRENDQLRELLSQMKKDQFNCKESDFSYLVDVVKKKDLEKSHNETAYRECESKLNCLQRENSELRHSLQLVTAEKERLLAKDANFRLEYKHLVSKHKRLTEKLKKKDAMLEQLQSVEKMNEHDKKDDVFCLRQKLQKLQQELCDAIRLRDSAEELCEKREVEALRDMTELQQLHRDLIEEERQRVEKLKMELKHARDDAEIRIQEIVQNFQQEQKVLEEENNALKRQLRDCLSSGRCPQVEFLEHGSDIQRCALLSENKSSLSSLSARPLFDPGTDSHCCANEELKVKFQRLQLENDRLSTELQQMEIKAEARDADNIKIKALLKEYERGDEGFRSLRNKLTESNRHVELLQEENAQLRERLNAMDSTFAFSAALQELCIRIGVTQEEIDRLHPKSGFLFSEVEVLREEVRTLKDEVVWLEKERRHWMDKVRLQPLLDAKLRLELGLSPEQLLCLERMVDKMKSQKFIVGDFDASGGGCCNDKLGEEDDDESYKNKYFHQLQLRQKEMEYFNDFVRHRIEEALREALEKKNSCSAADDDRALHVLQERINLITARSLCDTSQEQQPDVEQLRLQLKSALQLLDQSNLTIKDNTASLAALREQLASAITERDILLNERDKYRAVVFDVLGSAASETVADAQKTVVFSNLIGSTGGKSSSQSQSHITTTPVAAAEDAALSLKQTSLQDTNEIILPNASSRFISRTFEEQLLLKDEFIASLKNSFETCKNEVAQYRVAEANATKQLAEAQARQEDLRNQVLVFQQVNEELNEKIKEQTNTLEDLQEAIRHIDSGNTRELFQKIIVLRRREGKLVQRLRRAMETQEELARSEQTMRDYINTTFNSLKEALENTSTGFVLPPSSAAALSVENDIIKEVQQQLDSVLHGKLFKEDSAYLLQLQQVYGNMERMEQLYSLRVELKNQQKRTEEMEGELVKQRVELESLRSLQQQNPNASINDVSQTVRWETEAMAWRQKCDLYMRRLEDKEREASKLEAELADVWSEVALLREHLHKDGNRVSQNCNLKHLSQLQVAQQEQSLLLQSVESEAGQKEKRVQLPQSSNCLGCANSDKVRQLECDVARLKSINLGLLHHSLDMQGECKRIEIQLEATKQELSLVQETEGSRKVSDFVSAAIQQHAALRRQSELALLRAKRTKVQLCATEANLRVAVNEATAYRLGAFRLYRTYVTQMVAILHYIRSLHRSIKGTISPHRVEMLHQRFLSVVADIERTQAKQNDMTVRLAESSGKISLLQQQLELCGASDSEEKADALYAKLLMSLSAIREKDVRLAELQEDCSYMQQKLKRAETHTQQLTEELARLELRASGVGLFDGDILQKLIQLKETVFVKTESPAIIIQTGGTGPHDLDELNADAAISEYKQALDKQAELTRECSLLKKQLDDETCETRKVRAEAESLRDETATMRERLQYAQQQLEEERRKSEERQQRIIRSHEAQAEVTRRAAEHNTQCLKEMLRNKENCINHLQEQLTVERQKHLEYQLGESERMERLHEHLFRENKVMLERFHEAVRGAADNYTFSTTPHTDMVAAHIAQPDGVTEQLALLTKETLRLKLELKEARATNILLEAQLNEQVSKAQKHLLHDTPHNGHQVSQTPLHTEMSFVAIINDQNAIIESLRQRESNLTCEMQRCRKERDFMEQQLHEVRQFVVEQGGVLKSVVVTEANGTAVEQELRLQLTFTEKQLSETQLLLEEERQNVLRLQADTSQWRSHLDSLREEVVKQQADVERARHLVEMNKNLNEDIHRVEQQNQKLIMATNILKQRLLEQSRESGESLRKEQHELALAQRMSSIQLESTQQLKAVTERLNSIQQELENKARHEEEALKKHEEAQRVTYNLHKQLQEREEEILRMKHELAAFYSAKSAVGSGRREKGTQVLHTLQEGCQPLISSDLTVIHKFPPMSEKQKPKEKSKLQQNASTPFPTSACGSFSDNSDNILAKPHVAAALRRELERAQRNNMHEISLLRGAVRRLESDLEEARQQLQGGRDTNCSLRTSQNVRREFETRKLAVAQEPVTRQQHYKKYKHAETQTVGHVETSSVSGPVVVVPSAPQKTTSNVRDQLIEQQQENENLKRQVEQLKKRVVKLDDVISEAERYKKELANFRYCQPELVDVAHMASPLDIRSHKRIVIHLEGVIESLQRELNVNKETEIRNLQRRIDDLTVDNANLTTELNRRCQFLPSVQLPPTPLRASSASDRGALEQELLEKNAIILDLRFERETLQLKMGRMERHIKDILSVDSANAKRVGIIKRRDRVETLESVVENMKVVVERLQNENEMLKTKTVPVSKHMDLVRELRELRVSERKLREHSEMLTKRLVGLVPSGSAMSKRQAKLYRRLQTANATMEQYQTEMLELKQKLEERRHLNGDEMQTFEDNSKEELYYCKDRRAVQPLDDSCSSNLPPPLPASPVIATTVKSFNYGARRVTCWEMPGRRADIIRFNHGINFNNSNNDINGDRSYMSEIILERELQRLSQPGSGRAAVAMEWLISGNNFGEPEARMQVRETMYRSMQSPRGQSRRNPRSTTVLPEIIFRELEFFPGGERISQTTSRRIEPQSQSRRTGQNVPQHQTRNNQPNGQVGGFLSDLATSMLNGEYAGAFLAPALNLMGNALSMTFAPIGTGAMSTHRLREHGGFGDLSNSGSFFSSMEISSYGSPRNTTARSGERESDGGQSIWRHRNANRNSIEHDILAAFLGRPSFVNNDTDDVMQRAEDFGWELGDFSYENLLRLDNGNKSVGISPKLLRAMKPISYADLQKQKSSAKTVRSNEDQAVCAVCLEKLDFHEMVLDLGCGHVFHHQCIIKWLKRSTLCPTCRREVQRGSKTK